MKFPWTTKRELRRQLAERDETIKKLENECIEWSSRSALEASSEISNFKSQMSEHGPDDPRIAGALAVVDEANPQWRAVHALLNIVERERLDAALVPSLTSEQRHYNAGQAAALADFRAALLGQWGKARAANRASQ